MLRGDSGTIFMLQPVFVLVGLGFALPWGVRALDSHNQIEKKGPWRAVLATVMMVPYSILACGLDLKL